LSGRRAGDGLSFRVKTRVGRRPASEGLSAPALVRAWSQRGLVVPPTRLVPSHGLAAWNRPIASVQLRDSHARFHRPARSRRAIALATRRSRRRSGGCLCPVAVTSHGSIGVVIVAGLIHERRPCRRRGRDGARRHSYRPVPCSVPLARALPAAQGACWHGRSAANTRSATCPVAGRASLSRVARWGSLA
jgi:hypothetical protein